MHMERSTWVVSLFCTNLSAGKTRGVRELLRKQGSVLQTDETYIWCHFPPSTYLLIQGKWLWSKWNFWKTQGTKINFRMHEVDMTLTYHSLPIGTQKSYLLSKGELEMDLSSQGLKLNLKSVISVPNWMRQFAQS